MLLTPLSREARHPGAVEEEGQFVTQAPLTQVWPVPQLFGFVVQPLFGVQAPFVQVCPVGQLFGFVVHTQLLFCSQKGVVPMQVPQFLPAPQIWWAPQLKPSDAQVSVQANVQTPTAQVPGWPLLSVQALPSVCLVTAPPQLSVPVVAHSLG